MIAPVLLAQSDATKSMLGFVALAIFISVHVLLFSGMWMTFAKAGRPGWASLVPLYNFVVMCEIARKPTWWIVLLIIPLVNLIIAAIVLIDLVKAFGKGAGFAAGLILLPFIFWPILGFGKSQYVPVS